jgi:predicted phosphodiesterase
MRIQYVSDIHLELRSPTTTEFQTILTPVAPYLALCGDIGIPDHPLYAPFLSYCSKQFEHVFYVAGNHEYYNDSKAIRVQQNKDKLGLNEEEIRQVSEQFPIQTIQERKQRIREICQTFPNVHFLDKEVFQIHGWEIAGCTLWSRFQGAPYGYNDFRFIYTEKEKPFTVADYNAMFEEDIRFLQSLPPNPNRIVLTHHVPTEEVLDPKYRGSGKDNSFFATEVVDQVQVRVWMCGHTHGARRCKVNGVVVATNAYGYKGEDVAGFSCKATLEI